MIAPLRSNEADQVRRAAATRSTADAAVRAGRLSEAISMYGDALRLDPENPLIRNNLGRALSLAEWSVPPIEFVDLRLPLARIAQDPLRAWRGRFIIAARKVVAP